MKVDIPEDFPDGPAYANLGTTVTHALVCGWVYCARYETDVVPWGIWQRYGGSWACDELERAGLAELRSDPAGTHGVRFRLSSRPKRQTRTVARKPESDGLFDSWWSIWPRKQAKRDAERAFTRALNKIEFDALMDATRRYVQDPNREDRYTPHPATWLNGERWTDAPLPVDPARARLDAGARINTTVELGRQLAADMARHNAIPEMRALP